MIIAIIIDDELHARQFLSKLIARYFEKRMLVVEICDSVQSGVIAIKKHKPDIVFLDIQMPEENGFELFKKFKEICFEVIFTTAHKNYAIDAIRYSAFDYLLKPINQIDMLSAIKRYEVRKDSLKREERLSILLENLNLGQGNLNKIAIPNQNGFDFLAINHILYCESESNYCKIICLDGKQILLAKTLKYVENLINNSSFFRVHKSYLVNLNFIKNFKKNGDVTIELINGDTLPVSVRKKEPFLNAIINKA